MRLGLICMVIGLVLWVTKPMWAIYFIILLFGLIIALMFLKDYLNSIDETENKE